MDATTVRSKLDYRSLARSAAQQGITLLTNPNATLPLRSFDHMNIVVIGAIADDITSHVVPSPPREIRSSKRSPALRSVRATGTPPRCRRSNWTGDGWEPAS